MFSQASNERIKAIFIQFLSKRAKLRKFGEIFGEKIKSKSKFKILSAFLKFKEQRQYKNSINSAAYKIYSSSILIQSFQALKSYYGKKKEKRINIGKSIRNLKKLKKIRMFKAWRYHSRKIRTLSKKFIKFAKAKRLETIKSNF